MRILIIGEYPPLAGTVSAQGYWAAQSLQHAGHDVYVVSDGWHTDEEFRIQMTGSDLMYLNSKNPRFYSIDPLQNGRTKQKKDEHLPRLVSLALDVHERYDCDLIYTNALEVYTMAAHTVKKITGLPLIVSHFESNLEPTLYDPYLETYLCHILNDVDRVVAGPGQKSVYEYICPERTTELLLSYDYFSSGDCLPSLQAENDIPIIVLTDVINRPQFCAYIVDFFEQVKSEFILVIACYGLAAQHLRDLFKTSRVKNIVELGPPSPWCEFELMQKSTLVLPTTLFYPSKDYSNPEIILRLMASGTAPILLSQGNQLYPVSKENSFLVESDLLQTVEDILRNPEIAKAKGLAAKASYEIYHQTANIAIAIKTLFVEVSK